MADVLLVIKISEKYGDIIFTEEKRKGKMKAKYIFSCLLSSLN